MAGRNTSRAQLSHERAAPKLEERRTELAESALRTLAARGYANTSLRDIANNSPYSHGVVHYYFSDKFELIRVCLERYAETRRAYVEEVLRSDRSASSLRTAAGTLLANLLRDDADTFTLWYDIRSQAMFEPALRAAVDQIEADRRAGFFAILARYAELSGSTPSLAPEVHYAYGDGIMQQTLLRLRRGDESATDWARTELMALLDRGIRPTA